MDWSDSPPEGWYPVEHYKRRLPGGRNRVQPVVRHLRNPIDEKTLKWGALIGGAVVGAGILGYFLTRPKAADAAQKQAPNSSKTPPPDNSVLCPDGTVQQGSCAGHMTRSPAPGTGTWTAITPAAGLQGGKTYRVSYPASITGSEGATLAATLNAAGASLWLVQAPTDWPDPTERDDASRVKAQFIAPTNLTIPPVAGLAVWVLS